MQVIVGNLLLLLALIFMVWFVLLLVRVTFKINRKVTRREFTHYRLKLSILIGLSFCSLLMGVVVRGSASGSPESYFVAIPLIALCSMGPALLFAISIQYFAELHLPLYLVDEWSDER